MEARVRLKRVSPADLHLSRLPAAAGRAFLLCAELPLFRGPRWYLAGGTALALQVGHRQSVDLDFFTTRAERRGRRRRDRHRDRPMYTNGAQKNG